jgi:Rieske Fe-S protein
VALLIREIARRLCVALILPHGSSLAPYTTAMSDTNAPVTRRQFCAGACMATSGAAIATLFAACGGESSSPTSPSGVVSTLGILSGRLTGSAVQVTVADSPVSQVGGAVLVQSTAGVFLLAQTSASVFSAVEAVCTHEGCTITGADSSAYVCPCHGSRYNRSGQVLAGPARASLRQYRATFADGVVTIAL